MSRISRIFSFSLKLRIYLHKNNNHIHKNTHYDQSLVQTHFLLKDYFSDCPKMPLLDLYEKLQELESHLDKAVLRKKLLIEESHHKRIKCSIRARMTIIFEKFDNSYHLQIDGRVINNFLNNHNIKITDLFKRIVVKLNQHEQDGLDEYKSSPLTSDTETKILQNDKVIHSQTTNVSKPNEETTGECSIFEWVKNTDDNIDRFELIGTEKHGSITILFELENPMEKYKLSRTLQKLLQKETETKTGVLIDLWKYVRLNRLITDYNGYIVRCDDKLKRLFNIEIFQLIELPDLVDHHLLPLDPLIIEIPNQNNYSRKFDIPMEVDDFFDFPVLYQNNLIPQLDQKIINLFESLKLLRTRIHTLTKFHDNPKKFMNEWLIENGPFLKKQQFNLDHNTFYDPVVQQTIFEMMQCYNRSKN